MKKLKKPLIVLFIIGNLYAILSGGLFFFQDNLLFHPQPLPEDYTFIFDTPFKEVWLSGSDGASLHGIHFPVENAKGALLYYHGNAGSLARWGEIVQYFVKQGYAVVVMDYRQFGKSSGSLSEQLLYEDSLAWYDFVKKTYPNQAITVYGRSLGTTFATYVASQNRVKQLILETPFYSIQNEASTRFPFLPVKRLLKYRFPTFEFINKVSAPILVLHGTEDTVVDYTHAKRLYEGIESNEKRLVTILGGGHNNLIEFDTYTNTIEATLSK
ncbi:alpha/beta hydrolase [Dokdonia sp. Hel_I_53]|uniref:alpha/beta hydrolase n=1 Tax=Dokdonia sp. Hel_I_53 TaxID=1566287 RepID=UPI001199E6C6|nr:alpha/beta fold hydrolase [Dokdonia sp. Hel_I_53]TVZ51531.1 hypothetical protein OD90_0676 [Dokdonia sp. Hel_I_53]